MKATFSGGQERAESSPNGRGRVCLEGGRGLLLQRVEARCTDRPSDGGEAGCAHAERTDPEADEGERRGRVAGHLPADRQLDAGRTGGLDGDTNQAQERRVEGVAISLERRVATVDGERVLRGSRPAGRSRCRRPRSRGPASGGGADDAARASPPPRSCRVGSSVGRRRDAPRGPRIEARRARRPGAPAGSVHVDRRDRGRPDRSIDRAPPAGPRVPSGSPPPRSRSRTAERGEDRAPRGCCRPRQGCSGPCDRSGSARSRGRRRLPGPRSRAGAA